MSQLTGYAGEHYVIHRLYREGLLGALTAQGTQDFDVLAQSPDGAVTAVIQVKASLRGRKGWPVGRRAGEYARPDFFYCFVDFEPEPPVTYIVPSGVVADVISRTYSSYLATPGPGGRAHRDSSFRKVRHSYPYDPSIESGWLDPYRERWDLLTAKG